MAKFSSSDAEDYFEAHPEAMQDFFVRKAEMPLINRWLVQHGFCVLQEYIGATNRGSFSQDDATSPSPNELKGDVFFPRHSRSNSKKHLRHDFAKSKYRNMFRTYEPQATTDDTVDARRNSLKEMRMFRSLPQNSSNMLSVLIQSKVRLPRYPSKDIDKKRELRMTNEREFFMEIVKDISNDLDLRSLTAKIIANISVLTDGDQASVFVVEGKSNNKPSLVSKVFDVHSGTHILPSQSTDSSIRVPWGKGIIGHVADTGQTVNLTEACKDPRYNDEVDKITGYRTGSLLCMPVRNAEDEIVGVAQVINKADGGDCFSKEDEKMLSAYLAFCGIAINNAQIFEAYSKEYERNKALLEVVHDLFEEQTSLDNVILKIMQRAQVLLKCERCSVLLRDTNDETFSKVFDLANPVKNGHSAVRQDKVADLRLGNKIAELVLRTEETINIADAYSDPRFDRETDKISGFNTRSILCKPIKNRASQTIGVAQIINRIDGIPFDEHDEQLFEAFTIFCGLGINNAVLYEEVSLAAAKQTVALEVLSYHTSSESEEVDRLKRAKIPESRDWRLNSFSFNDFSLSADEMVLAGIRMFKDLGLMRTFRIEFETLCRWLTTVKKNYRHVAYHNWRHAFNVCQLMFASMQRSSIRRILTDRECLALTVACVCHDLDHRGTNNAFQQKTSSALSQLYGTKATLEHHHFNHAVMILNSEGHSIFANFSPGEYGEVINLLKDAILATDLSLHIQVRNKWFAMVDQDTIDWDDRELKGILRSILMTTCDIGAITKPWDVSRKVADLVMTEFFDQGDKERSELKIQPQAHMDREKQDQMPALQLGWIDGICLPLYKSLSKFDPAFRPMMEEVMSNRSMWEVLDAERLDKQSARESCV